MLSYEWCVSMSNDIQSSSFSSRSVSRDLECLWLRLKFLELSKCSWQFKELFFAGGSPVGFSDASTIIWWILFPQLMDLTSGGRLGSTGRGLEWPWIVAALECFVFGNNSKNCKRSTLFESRLLGAAGKGLFWNRWVDPLLPIEPSVINLFLRDPPMKLGGTVLREDSNDPLFPSKCILLAKVWPLVVMSSLTLPGHKVSQHMWVHWLGIAGT